MLTRTIRITRNDHNRLLSLLSTLSASSRSYGTNVRDLRGELERAEIMASELIPSDVIVLGSTAQLLDMDSQQTMTFTLVLPHEADIDKDMISILAPIGTAMLGYAEGDTFEWKVPGGLKRMKVIRVQRKSSSSQGHSDGPGLPS